jgi:Putative Actinobacterial Holin-X, holin superfamily III
LGERPGPNGSRAREEAIDTVSDPIGGNGGVGQNASNGTSGAAASGQPPKRPKRPLGAVITSAMDGTRTLVRKQVELARIEVTEALSVRAKGAGMMAGAALMALFALGFAAAAGSVALALVLPAWAANLIVAAVFVAIAGTLALIGRNAIRNAPTTPDQTQQTLKEDARWARQQLAR